MTVRLAVQVLAALFAVYMLFRYGRAALRALRGEERDRVAALMPLLNVALALAIIAVAILAVAVKGLAGRLMWR